MTRNKTPMTPNTFSRFATPLSGVVVVGEVEGGEDGAGFAGGAGGSGGSGAL